MDIETDEAELGLVEKARRLLRHRGNSRSFVFPSYYYSVAEVLQT
ncbi:unnamed protein product [Linum tenue]|uniref:Uncharacterized protein n=1 Tax=Linum tenue TaxID=586396 RepID=A0AAV0K751_9ROSI|nr:unnamed protein product [Linum tenue]